MIAGTHDLALFALTVLVVNATPGVDLLYTLVCTLRQGLRGGLAAAAGIGAGCVVHALAAAFGLAALMAASSAAFGVLKWAGAAYLLWLALGLWRQAFASPGATKGPGPGPAPAPAAAAEGTAWRIARQGFLTNVLNPKVAIFFLALLPQFIAADAPDPTAAFLVLGAWFVLQGTAFLALLVLLVLPLRRWQPGERLRRGLHLAGGTLFAVLAARLALAPR